MDNRRKVNEALNQIINSDRTYKTTEQNDELFVNQLLNSSIQSTRSMKPKVMTIGSNS